ncbi:MAG: FAD-binding oxidoreductase [Desulfobacteraceae bacterium]|nr:MAG: FAD-binding oxidoreductase [Desulfobacteraceae bacterium]
MEHGSKCGTRSKIVEKMKRELIGILGEKKVTDGPETLEAYAKDQSFTPLRRPSFLVAPENVGEVQALVRWANRTLCPLVPVSSGPPHFYGDTVPTAGGAVIVDLRRMNRIIRMDRRNRMAIVEPGVTYSELQPALAREGLRLSMPLLPRANKSVVAGLLERQPVTVPKYQWVLLEPLRCLEIVWGNGDRLVTGEAGEYGPLEEQWKSGFAQVSPMGPGQVDYWRLVSAAQGSMGIVSWASIRCEVLPVLHRFFFIPAEKINGLIDCAYKLLRVRLGDEFLMMDNATLAAILRKDNDQHARLRDQLPQWVIIVGVAGRDRLPEERCAFQQKDISAIAKQSGLQMVSSLPGVSDGEIADKLLKPSEDPYWKIRRKGAFQDIFFLTTLDQVPGHIEIVRAAAEALNYPAEDVSIYIQPQHQGVCCHCEFTLSYDPDNEKEAAGVKELVRVASDALMRRKAFFSRPYGIWADMVYGRDARQTSLLKGVKQIFDPNCVMNPGKLCF